jgi:hypothetical protein
MLLKIIISVMIWCFVLILPLIYEPANTTSKQFRIFCWCEFIVLIVGTIIVFNLK